MKCSYDVIASPVIGAWQSRFSFKIIEIAALREYALLAMTDKISFGTVKL
ncbi:MAG: hypothetical protein V1661_01255 [bacterium]